MGKNEIKKFLLNNKGYLKWGKHKLAKKFNVPIEEIREVVYEIKGISLEFKRLFFDIETSYNIGKFWRTGYNQTVTPSQIIKERAVICVSYKWEGEDKVYNLTWDKNQSDKKLLTEFTKILKKADEIVAHNGDRFDVKWLRTRCLMHRLPFPTYIKTLDTLKKVKSMFNFQSNKLDYIASVLGFGHKVDTGGLELWDKIILGNDKKALDKMVKYCNHDVVLLQDVYNTIQSYIKPNLHVGLYHGGNRYDCPSCGDFRVKYIKPVFTVKGTLQRQMECENCSSDYIISDVTFKNYIKNKEYDN